MNINLILKDIYANKHKDEMEYNSKMYSFLTDAYKLVGTSKGIYQIEDTTKLNKISLKDYILNSDCCIKLKEANIKNYSIDELKKYVSQYEASLLITLDDYRLAIKLYELLDEIEKSEKERIKKEVNGLETFLEELKQIKSLNKNQYKDLYNNIFNKIKVEFINKNLIDEEHYGYFRNIMNDIFNFYLNGYTKIPKDMINI